MAVGAEEFEDLEVLKFRWLVRSLCCRPFLFLKEASNYLAILGTVMSLIILVFGAGGSFLLWGLRDPTIHYYGIPEYYVAGGVGVLALVHGILLLIYNIILLNNVRNNRAAGVFKTIKVGCLFVLFRQVLWGLLLSAGFVCLLAEVTRTRIPFAGQVGGLVGSIVGLLLTSLHIYAVLSAKPKILSRNIYKELIILVIGSILLGYFLFVEPFVFQVCPAVIVGLAILILENIYIVELFVLHLNMMTITEPSKNQLHGAPA